jgi:hypothetical protein
MACYRDKFTFIIIIVFVIIIIIIITIIGVRGSVVGWSTMLQAGRSRIRFPMRSLDF